MGFYHGYNFVHFYTSLYCYTQHNSTHHRAIIMCVCSPIKSLPPPSYSFVVKITSAVGFIMASLFLRVTEGIGSTMFTTSAYALIPKLFPNHITIVVVSHIPYVFPRINTPGRNKRWVSFISRCHKHVSTWYEINAWSQIIAWVAPG